eukprot:335434-Chlamydomonas_euryale.AAC.1
MLVDSGLSTHLVSDLGMLRGARPTHVELSTVTKGLPIVASAVGKVDLETYSDEECTRLSSQPVTLKNVLYYPDAGMDLTSTQRLSSAGGEVTISNSHTIMRLGNRTAYAPIVHRKPAYVRLRSATPQETAMFLRDPRPMTY